SGAPTDPAVPSANPGQSITVTGAGLTKSTDVVVQYTDQHGTLSTLLINPTLADLDGTSAQVILPAMLNGVVRIGVFGSPTALPVQIVPLILQATIRNGILTHLAGRGFVDGQSTYEVGDTRVFDADIIFGPDVTGSNSAVDLAIVAAAGAAV